MGALVTAFGTWRVSVSLDGRQRTRERTGAVKVVRVELLENTDRLRQQPDATLAGLTYGDWAQAKVILSALPDQDLWEDVRAAYNKIFEAVHQRPDPDANEPLTAERLASLEQRLDDQAAGFR